MFGKTKERRRQWSLLGILLGKEPLLGALEFMDAVFGATAVDWIGIREKASRGRSLLEIAEEPPLQTPPDVLDALEAGEQDGRLPERLAELVPRVDPVDRTSPQDEGVVSVVNRLFAEAIEQGAGGLLLLRGPTGEGELKVLQGEVWRLHSRYPADECSALVRRMWLLAGQPYWAPKAGVIRTRIPQGSVEMRLTPGREAGLGIEIVTVPAS